jgi:hypothetical protein
VVLGKVRSDTTFESIEEHRLGAAGHFGVSLRETLVLVLRAEYLHNPADRDVAAYLGVRLGGRPAMWSSLIGGPLFGLAALVFSN